MHLAELQTRFLDALLQPPSLQPGDGLHLDAPATGFSIYANAYRARLIETLATDHQKLQTCAGADQFTELATGYIDAHPSTHRSLRYFGATFPKYIDSHDLPLLAELASFERLLLDVYDAQDAETADRSVLSTVPQQHWPSLQFAFHPSVRIFVERHGGVQTWKQIDDPKTDEPTRLPGHAVPPDTSATTSAQPECVWLLWRDATLITRFRSLEAIESAMVKSLLLSGQTLALAAQSAYESAPAADLADQVFAHIQRWFGDGLIIGVSSDALD